MARIQRKYALKFGKPLQLDKHFFTPVQEPTQRMVNLEDYYDSKDDNGYLIEDHDISYRVTKTSDATKNTCEVTVKNLSESLTKYVMNSRGKDLYVEFDVGYVGEVKNLFKGTMKEATATKQGNDTLLKIMVVDGTVNDKALTTRAYPVGTKFSKIFEDLRLDLSVHKGNIVELPPSLVTSFSVSVFGNTWSKLASLADQVDHDFSVSNGQMNLTPKNGSYSKEVAYISATSGLLGNVTPVIRRGTEVLPTSKDTTQEERIRFTCQTDASIRPPLSVYVDAPDDGYVGVYKVEKASFTCNDFNKGGYTVAVECIKTDEMIRG